MKLLTLLLAIYTFCVGAADAAPGFILGIIPVHSARVLAERYEPLRDYLEQTLKQPVRIESAPDFRRFHERTLRGDFDLTITPAHFARIAQKDAGHQPLAQFTPDHDALLIFSSERPLSGIRDLKEKKLAVIDRLAITVTATMQYLESQGLRAEQDYQIVEYRTHASTAFALISGLAAAAVTTSQGLLQMPDELRRKMVVQKHIADIPSFFLVARANMDKTRSTNLKNALLAFPDAAEGIDFLGHTGYDDVIPASEAALRRADGYLKETRRALK